MGFEQYHELANELSAGTRTFVRMIVPSCGMHRRKNLNISPWISTGFFGRSRNGVRSHKACSFQTGDIVEHGEEAEEKT